MSDMPKATILSARERTHIKFCQNGPCVFKEGEQGEICRELDRHLTMVEEQALHHAAGRVSNLHMYAMLQHGAEVGQGLTLAVKEIDPYRRDPYGKLTRADNGSPVPRFKGDPLWMKD